jgi:hypothetical protein
MYYLKYSPEGQIPVMPWQNSFRAQFALRMIVSRSRAMLETSGASATNNVQIKDIAFTLKSLSGDKFVKVTDLRLSQWLNAEVHSVPV